MRRWLPVVVMAASTVAGVVSAVTAAATDRGQEVREGDRRRREAHLALTARYWGWQGELVRKGRHGPAQAHPWLGKLGVLRGKDAGDYLKDRKLRGEADFVQLSIESKRGSRDDLGWIGEFGGRVLDKNGHIGVVVEVPLEVVDRLLRDERVDRVRPLVSDAERFEQRAKVRNSRGASWAVGGKTEKWRSPVENRDVDVLKGAVAVNFKEGVGLEQAEDILSSYGCWIAEENPDLTFARYIVKCRDEDSLPQLLDWIGSDPDTDYVDVVGVAQPVLTPNDPRYPEQWSLNNTGAVIQLSGTPDADIDAPEGWGRDTGSNNVIAIVDSGVDLNHEDLRTKLWVNPNEAVNGVDDDGNGLIDDINGYDFGDGDPDPSDQEFVESGRIIGFGHGTNVAGVAAAASNNGIGITGVNWGARIMALKVRDSSNIMTAARVASAIRYAARKGAGVINISLSIVPAFMPDVENAIAEADNRGSVVVAASGNDGADTVSYPGSNVFTLAVGATDKDDRRAKFSNGGIALGLVAPGVQILTTRVGNRYERVNGTSFAAPHVAGAAAFVRSLAPALTTAEVRELLKRNTDLIAGQVGFSIGYGHGRLNLDKVVLAAQEAAIGTPPPPPPPVPLQVNSAAAIDSRYVDVNFNKPLDPISAAVTSNYGISPALDVTGVFLLASGRTARLKTAPQTASTGYTVTVTGVKDSSGSLVGSPNSATFTGLAPSGGESFLWRIMATANESAGGSRLTFSQGFLATFSNDGLRAVFTKEAQPLPPTFQSRFFLYSGNTDGSGITQIIPEDSDPRHSDVDSDWSPVSDKVVFAGMRTVGGNSFSQNIYTVNSDGSGLFRLTPLIQTLQQRDPTWSPDASQIAFIESGGNIFKMNANGTGKTLVTGGNFKIGLSWHPSGSPIAYQQQDLSGDNVYTVNPDGSNVRLLIQNARTPIWSPDGQRIAFARSGAVIVADANGANEQFITGGFLFPRVVDWLADGIRVSASDNAGTFLVAVPPLPPFSATSDWRLGIAYSTQDYVSPYTIDLTPRYGGVLSNLQTTLEDDSDIVVTTFTMQVAGNLMSGDVNGAVDTVAPGPPSNLRADGSSPSPWSNQKGFLVTMDLSPDPAGIAGAFFKSFTPPVSAEDGDFFSGQNSFGIEMSPTNGENQLFVWLKDRAGNVDPANTSTITIRYDDIPPTSLALAPSTAAAAPVSIAFQSSDPGEGALPPSGSGGERVYLWVRMPSQSWSLSGQPSTGTSGSLSFTPAADGIYEFYTQAEDVAGNLEPIPVATTPAKAATMFDATPPAISNIVLPVISFAQAHLAWETDDQSIGLVEYGTTTAFGHSRATLLGNEHLAVLDCSLLSPATIYYRITATNLTGLTSVSAVASFVTPPLVTAPVDLFGVIDPSQPIDVQVTNPDIMNATFTIDGQAGFISFSTATGFQIFLDTGTTGSGLQILRIALNGFVYETQFLVDTATRSVRLTRAVFDAGGVMTDSTTTPGSSVADAALGEPAHEAMSGPGSRLHLGFYAAIDPVAPAVITDLAAMAGAGAGQVILSWSAVGDDAGVGTAMKYDLRRATEPIDDANFAAASPVALSTYPALAGTAQQAVISGLSDGTTYYFAIKAVDEMLNASPFGGGASAKTLEVSRSADLTNGQPTVEFLSFVSGVTVTQVSTTTTSPALALATSAAAAQGLLFYSTLYDIVSPDPSLPGGATIQFRYLDPGDPTFEANLRVYEFKESLSQWVLIADVGPAANQDFFFLPIPGLSFYAIMFRDAAPPITSLEPRGGSQFVGTGGTFFASTATVYGLTARDPPQGGFPASGVSRSEFRVDSSSIPFALLGSSASFGLAGGFHTVQFRSVDNAGNVEPIRSAVVVVDAAAPVASMAVDAPSVPSPGGLAVLSATTTLTISLQDPLLPGGAPGGGSGVQSISYRLDGGSLTAASASFSLFLGTGTHLLSLLASDHVGNLLDNTSAPFRIVVGDALPPRTSAEFGVPSAGADPVYLTSATPIVLRSVDDLLQLDDAAGLGVAFQEVALTSLSSGTTRTQRFSAAVSTFLASVEADGLYSLSFFAEDVAGNRELVRRSTVAVDDAPPSTTLVPGAPSYAGPRLFVSTRTLLSFAASDPVIDGAASGVERTLYVVDGESPTVFSTGFSLAGGTRSLAFQSFDRLGNAEVVRSTLVAVDADAPQTEISFLGPVAAASSQTVPADADAFLSGASAVALAAEETGSTETASGVALTRYRLDAGAFSVYGGTFPAPAEGLRLLEFQSLDRVDNEEGLRLARVAVDTTPPTVELVVHGPSYPLDGRVFISSASILDVAAADPVSGGVASGVGEVEFRVDPASGAPFVPFVSSFTFPAGAHLVESKAHDRVGNESEVLASDVFVDTAAPFSTLVVGLPQADLGGGVMLVSPLTPLLVVSTDPAAAGAASGVRETLVAVDSGAFTVLAGSFTLSGDGPRLVRFFARDNILNAEDVRAASLVVDGAAPVVALLSPSPAAAGVDQAFGRGLVPVFATVSDVHLSSYTLEFAAGVEASGGFAVIAAGTASVTGGVIARWDTSALSGFYTLRLSAADALGAVSLSTAAVFIGDPGAVLVIKNREGHGHHGDRDELLDKPEGVAVGADGAILVANTGKDEVLKFGPQGALLAAFDGRTTLVPVRRGGGHDDDDDGHGKGKDKHDDHHGEDDGHDRSETISFKKPTGLAVDEAANVYVADRNNDRIAVLSSTGVVLRSVGRTNQQGRFIPGKGRGEFNKPTGVAVSPSRIAVADRNNGRVQVFDRSFGFLYDIKLDEVAPGSGVYHDDDDDEDSVTFAVSWGPDGTLYVTDEGNHRVLVFDASGTLLAQLGSRGSSLGRFSSPKGAAVSALSYLYVADRGNERVQKFDPFREAVLASGSSLGLEQPTGLALDATGYLYVTDRKTDRVLKLGLPAPTVVVTAPASGSGKTKRGRVSREGGKLTRPDRVTVDIPAGALAQELEISIEPEKAADPEEEQRKKRAKEQKSLAAVSEGVEYGPEGTVFNAPVTITLVYDPKSLPPGAREDDLKVHYWNPVKSEWEEFPSTVDKELRTVSAKTMHFSLYQVMGSGTGSIAPLADASFGVKAAYVFPNPVRGQRTVTFRMQPGVADSVEVRVYDVTGRKVHESSAFADRGAFDDGNGLGAQFTYDHVWDVSGVGAGVYTYVLVARRAGQSDVRKTGKVALIK